MHANIAQQYRGQVRITTALHQGTPAESAAALAGWGQVGVQVVLLYAD